MAPVSPPLIFLCLSSLLCVSSVATPIPKAWPPDAFLPLTEQRIAALPPTEQSVWRAYWDKSVAQAKLGSARDLVDHSATKPLPGGPIGSSYSKGVRLDRSPSWYASEEARAIADHVVNWQTAVGAWV